MRTALRRWHGWGPYLLMGSGFLLMAVSVLWYKGMFDTVAQAAYDPADVVYDRPLHGVHEMGPPKESPPSCRRMHPNLASRFRKPSTIWE